MFEVIILKLVCVAGGLRIFKKEWKSDEREGGGGKEGKRSFLANPSSSPPLLIFFASLPDQLGQDVGGHL